MVSGKASESLDLMVSGELFISPVREAMVCHLPVSGSKRLGGHLTRHGRGDWSSMGGGCVDAAGGEVSVEVPEGLEVFGGS